MTTGTAKVRATSEADITKYAECTVTVSFVDFIYNISAGKTKITRYIGHGGVVTIPSTIGRAPVTSIGKLDIATVKFNFEGFRVLWLLLT